MSEKITYTISAILFVVLVALMICERMYPEGGAALLPVFRSLCLSIGREVRALSPRGDVCGRAVDIDGEGRLVIETETGRVAVSAGEVQLRTAQGYL